MSEEIDKQVFRKYDIEQRLGKGVIQHLGRRLCKPWLAETVDLLSAGVWNSVEGQREEVWQDNSPQENF